MNDPRKNNEAFNQFMQQSAWTNTGEGWKRAWMNGIMMEIVDVGNSFYQAIANRNGPYPFHDRERFRFETLEKAKTHAWQTFEKAKELLPNQDDGQPAKMELDPT